MGTHAAVTIVSKNYLAYAETLATSYKACHPDHDFIVILVDKADGYVNATLASGAEVIEIANLAIPDISRFIYRYSIMELNTAVKPFAMSDLFARRQYDTLLYIDPDVYIFRPLEHVYEALKTASIVLTPHLRQPYFDDGHPNEVSILQSGTYNLGFLGLRRGLTATALLEWWMTKLYKDCVVDVPSGLFVDQKWIDLIPGFFPDHFILHEPGYNAAYWNLHERPITKDDSGWRAGGQALFFYHFSGYNPLVPQILSKHQDRHNLLMLPTLRKLTDFYGQALLDAGFFESHKWPYAFDTLSNGVKVPLSIVNMVMQWAVRNKVPTPCPISNPDLFCRFLMSRDLVPERPRVVLLFEFLLRMRSDVRRAYPGAHVDSDDLGFRAWLSESGTSEYSLTELLKWEEDKRPLTLLTRMFNQIDKSAEKEDGVPGDFWDDPRKYKFQAIRESRRLTKASPTAGLFSALIDRCIPAVGRILNIYFLRGDLQQRFSRLWTDQQISEFGDWLRINKNELSLTDDQVSFFEHYAKASRVLIERMRLVYVHNGRSRKLSPNIYEVDRRRYEVVCQLSTQDVIEFLYEAAEFEPIDHYLEYVQPVNGRRRMDPRHVSIEGLDPTRTYLFGNRVLTGLAERKVGRPTINLAGYFRTPSGMGEAARSMRGTLAKLDATVKEISLPNPRSEYDALPETPFFFGWPASAADMSITVANADSTPSAQAFLPNLYWSPRNVGYWLWESEELPFRFKPYAEAYTEIWAPSAYCAAAISKVTDLPVKVVPLALDLEAIALARGDRARFGLPSTGTLFGFMFDPDSGIYRKNVAGLIEAFSEAFAPGDNCYLVLKINGNVTDNYDYHLLRARTIDPRVIFVERTLSRRDTYDFLATLDAYVSLHRAEGFGLTCAEAMALALPVVASNYSGNLQFMDQRNSLLVETERETTNRAYGPYGPGTTWGSPVKESAIASLRLLLSKDRRVALGELAMRDVKALLSAKRVSELLLEAVGIEPPNQQQITNV